MMWLKLLFVQLLQLTETWGEKLSHGGNVDAAKLVGEAIAQKALKAGVKECVFDRGGFLYHGRISALADAAREAGLDF